MKLSSLFSASNRTGRFLRMLATSNVGLVATVVYSMGMVPIILYFTSVADLGLWTLLVQFTGYLGLVDLGVSSACTRRFVGPIARKEIDALSASFKTAFIISAMQGAFCCLLAFLVFPMSSLLAIPQEKADLFCSVLFIQTLLVGAFFVLRPFSSILQAAQRYELNHAVSAITTVLSLAIIWFGLKSGTGLWTLPLVWLVQQSSSVFATLFMLKRLKLFPAGWKDHRASWYSVTAFWGESLDFFSWSGFSILGSSLQSVFLSRFLGLEAVAIWSVGTKLASFAYMLFSNFFNTAFMGLSELFEKGAPQNCLRSFLDLFIPSLSCLTIFAGCAVLFNDLFILLWTHGQIAFAPSCTWAIFSWLIFAGTLRALACFSNIWQNRKTMRIGPAVEFASLVLFLGLSLSAPCLKWFAFALMASQIPPILLSYGPSFLLVRKFFNVRLSNNQWGTIVFSLAFFISAIGVRAFHASYVPQALLLSFLALPWVYFFLKELKAFMLLRRS